MVELAFHIILGAWEWLAERTHRRRGWRAFWVVLLVPIAVIAIVVAVAIALGV